ncbi:hypothetical protein ACP70R_046592 [Stipagrostis hirtigluma subsp. patula]
MDWIDKGFFVTLLSLGLPDKAFARWSRCVGGFPGLAKWVVQEAAAGRRELIDFPNAGRHLSVGDFVDWDHEAEVHFTGKLSDGTVFASSKENDTPLVFQLAHEDVMKGFSLAVSSMQVGERAVFNIPPKFAETMRLSPPSIPCNIPPNQTLQFDIELISIITDILEDEGILKKTIKFGTGRQHPRDLDEVLVNYNAFLEDGISMSKSEGVEFSLAEGFFCPALAHVVKTMTKGEEAILIIQPKYGFSKRGRAPVGNEAAVPPDATLYVHLHLISWITVFRIGKSREILMKTKENSWERKKPCDEAIVKVIMAVRLIGKLQDGTVFDRRGYDGEEPFEFTIDEEPLICGLDEGVMAMQEGEFASFTIPPQHAFGAIGSSQYQLGVVPPNSTVIYEIELLSVDNGEDQQHRQLTHRQKIKYARRKENEGDHMFNSGNYLRAYRKYFKASRTLHPILSHVSEETSRMTLLMKFSEEQDAEFKETLVSLALKSAECAIQLQYYEQAIDCYREVLWHDKGNGKAQQMLAHILPRNSAQKDAVPMHRDLKRVRGHRFNCSASILMLKKGHKARSEDIFVPGQVVSAIQTAASVGSSSATTNSQHDEIEHFKKDRGCIIC